VKSPQKQVRGGRAKPENVAEEEGPVNALNDKEKKKMMLCVTC